jgi:hypothetical protein
MDEKQMLKKYKGAINTIIEELNLISDNIIDLRKRLELEDYQCSTRIEEIKHDN